MQTPQRCVHATVPGHIVENHFQHFETTDPGDDRPLHDALQEAEQLRAVQAAGVPQVLLQVIGSSASWVLRVGLA